MRFLKNPKFDPLEARTSGFTGSMGGKWVAGVVFRPKPPPEPNFTKIGPGHRTGPYIRLLHFLVFGLLSTTHYGGLIQGDDFPITKVKMYLFGVAVVAFPFFLFSSSASMTVVMLAFRPPPPPSNSVEKYCNKKKNDSV